MNTGIRPRVVDQIRALALRYDLNRVILFGSRARGSHQPKSDIDLAASGGNVALFRLAVEEETDTLLTYDVVDLDHSPQPELLRRIQEEGITFYEKV